MGVILSPVAFILHYIITFGNNKASVQKIMNKNFKYSGNTNIKSVKSFVRKLLINNKK
jgi:hypothetical protein